MTSSITIPPLCAIGFKEWSGICDALHSGRQSLLLRKGGIAEDGGGFRPEHPVFWLYPTHLHEVQQGLKDETIAPWRPSPQVKDPSSQVAISLLAAVAYSGYIDHDSKLAALDELHVWTEETVRRRFHYRQPGLWVLGVRVYRRLAPWLLEVTPAQAGCKSWVALEEPIPTTDLAPAIDDNAFARVIERIRFAVETAPQPR
jgi:hypothetical protein